MYIPGIFEAGFQVDNRSLAREELVVRESRYEPGETGAPPEAYLLRVRWRRHLGHTRDNLLENVRLHRHTFQLKSATKDKLFVGFTKHIGKTAVSSSMAKGVSSGKKYPNCIFGLRRNGHNLRTVFGERLCGLQTHVCSKGHIASGGRCAAYNSDKIYASARVREKTKNDTPQIVFRYEAGRAGCRRNLVQL